MKYFLIAGEASGDLHAAQLIRELRQRDSQAEFRFLGGDEMASQAGSAPIVHYKDMAYMGFSEVIKHLGSILGIMGKAKSAIRSFMPNAVILIDYPSFNLKIAKFAHQLGIPCFYFISPKVWAWKSWRVNDIKKHITALYSILPFEPQWFAERNYTAQYVGNPSVKEIEQARAGFMTRSEFCQAHGIGDSLPIVAIVPGSRQKEIRDNLPVMLDAASSFGCTPVIAGAPNVPESIYLDIIGSRGTKIIFGNTMQLVSHSRAALVTSGTATLETAILATPQIVCYRMSASKLLYWMREHFLSVKYISLPNLITDAPVIPELLLHQCSARNIAAHLEPLLSDSPQRQAMLSGYHDMMSRLGNADCALNTAKAIISRLS